MSLETTNRGLQKALSALRKQNQQLKKEVQIWRNTAMSTQVKLVEFLKNLDSAESHRGIWVNRENIDQYRIGEFSFENGGVLDHWICIGSLDKLSFGFQSWADAIAQYLEDENSFIKYKDKLVRVNIGGILDAYSNGLLDEDFREFLEEKAEEVQVIWSQMKAENFVINQIPKILSQAKEEELV